MRAATLYLALLVGFGLTARCVGEAVLAPGSEPGVPLGALDDAGTWTSAPTRNAPDWPLRRNGASDAAVGSPDAAGGTPDTTDAGPSPVGNGQHDAGPLDAGAIEARSLDAGHVDAGVANGGPPDASLPPGCVPLQGVVTSLARGTYCVTGDVIVPTGVTLDVPPGTTFIVMGRHHFGRDPAIPDLEPPAIPGSGTIHAIGTAAEPIVFRGATALTGWFGIVVSHSHDTVHFEYVTVRDTNKDDQDPNSRIWRRGGALNSYVNAKGTILRHCTFINNQSRAQGGAVDINSHGQWPNQGPVEITDTLFEDNACECAGYGATDICSGGAIHVSHVGGPASLVTLRNNVFRHDEARKSGAAGAYGGAIGGFDSSLILGPGHVFDANRAASGDGALSCDHQPALGSVISSIDVSTVFTNNVPDIGCGL